MYKAKAYAAASATAPLVSTTIPRRDPAEHDVQIEILFCGICHSDLHSVRNEWSEFMATTYPIVPGHEILGRVTKVGAVVTKFNPGDLAAVGCLVDSDPTSASAASPMGATPTASSSTNASCCASPPTSIPPGPRRSSARGSRRTHPCATGASPRARRLASSVSADWVTWA